MNSLKSLKIGLALSGGSVRGLAHIGVIKALAEIGVRPSVITGTSVGSLIGAGIAAGLDWKDLAEMARSVFWPSLLRGERLEQFCADYLPDSFSDLRLPFAAVATNIGSKTTMTLKEGPLAPAISASCAMRVIRRPVLHNGARLKDGGMTCVLPAVQCREMGAEFVISSDVWELSSILRGFGLDPQTRPGSRIYPGHYREAMETTDIFVMPPIPKAGYIPGSAAVDRMIRTGEASLHLAVKRYRERL